MNGSDVRKGAEGKARVKDGPLVRTEQLGWTVKPFTESWNGLGGWGGSNI